MKLQTITKVSKAYGVSTRTLRYYEQIGLLKSSEQPGYAYRAYDEKALNRLQQILVLRKLRIPLKQIGAILETRDAQLAIGVFEESIQAAQQERQALETIEAILQTFLIELEKNLPAPLSPDVFEQQHLVEWVQALADKQLLTREETTMKELNHASRTLEQPKNIRIIYLPPMTVASCQKKGENQEEVVNGALANFIQASGLAGKKPDFRRFGFNNPASEEGDSLGYEAWVSVPDDWEIPETLVRKEFLGGLYGAHAIGFGEFHEWGNLWKWVMGNEEYEVDFTPRVSPADEKADPGLEEQLNAIHHLEDTTPLGTQLDLLVPIRRKGQGED